MAVVQAVRAADFIDAEAVAAHPHYTDSAPQANAAGTLEDLRYLGVHNVRTDGPNPSNQGQGTLAFLADNGIDFSFVAGGDPATALARIKAFLQAHPDSVAVIEGVNEPNNWPIAYAGKTGAGAAVAFQADLYAAVDADPALAAIPVAGMSSYPKLGAPSDLMNLHPYPKGASQPRAEIASELAGQKAVETQQKGFAITEGGWHTGRADGEWEGVDERTQAKLLLNFMMDGVDLGASFVAPYELYDEYADPNGTDWWNHWGMFRFDGTPKQSAVALHNLNAILADGGADASTFAAGSLDYTVTGGANDYLLQQSDGDRFLVLWNEPDLWDDAANKPIDPADVAATLNLQGTWDVEVFDPMAGTAAVRGLKGVSAATVALDGHPLVLRLFNGAAGGGGGTTAAPAPAATGSAIGGTEGPDSLAGGDGNDTINGWGRDDTLSGGAGDDVLSGGWGADRIATGAGHDRVVVLQGEGGETVTDFDPASDVLEVKGAPAGTAATATDTAEGVRLAWAGDAGVLLLGVKAASLKAANLQGVALAAPVPAANLTLQGTAGADALTGGAGADRLLGLGGNDTLSGGDGGDALNGGAGDDRLDGGAGNDWLVGGPGADTLTGGAGPDRFAYQSLDERGDTITDFDPAGYDRLDLRAVFGNTGERYASLAAKGMVKAAATGGGVLVSVDLDGGGDNYVALAMLQKLTVAGLGNDFLIA